MIQTKPVPIGHILHAHGMEGEVLVEPYLNDLSYYERLRSVLVAPVDGFARSIQLLRVRQASDRLLMQIDGVSSVEAARALVGHECYVYRNELPPAREGEFYWFDLEGLTVVTEEGECLGRVEEFFPTGSNAVLVVRKEAQETLLPFIKDVIVSVDNTKGTLRIHVIPGLL